LAAVSVFIEPAPVLPELLELELVAGAAAAPGACVALLPPGCVIAGVAGLSAGAVGAAEGVVVFCAMATPITPAVAMVAAAAAMNFVLVMWFSFRD